MGSVREPNLGESVVAMMSSILGKRVRTIADTCPKLPPPYREICRCRKRPNGRSVLPEREKDLDLPRLIRPVYGGLAVREKAATGAAGEHPGAVTGATGEHPGAATGADPEGGEIQEGGSTRTPDLLKRRIQAQGYRLPEVAQALGWPPDNLDQARDRDLTCADIILICELIGESVADFLVEVGWLSQEDTAIIGGSITAIIDRYRPR